MDTNAILLAAAAGKLPKGWHVSVSWGPEMFDDKPLPHWLMLISAPTPVLGQPRLMHVKDLGYGEPTEAMVRTAVDEAVPALNELARKKLAEEKLAAGNGHG